MIEPERIAPLTTATARKKAHDRLVRRSTTAAVGAAICLTGMLSGAVSAAPTTGRPGAQPGAYPDDSSSEVLARALADYQAAVDARSQQAPTQPSGRLAPARYVAPPRRAPAPVAVTGGS